MGDTAERIDFSGSPEVFDPGLRHAKPGVLRLAVEALSGVLFGLVVERFSTGTGRDQGDIDDVAAHDRSLCGAADGSDGLGAARLDLRWLERDNVHVLLLRARFRPRTRQRPGPLICPLRCSDRYPEGCRNLWRVPAIARCGAGGRAGSASRDGWCSANPTYGAGCSSLIPGRPVAHTGPLRNLVALHLVFLPNPEPRFSISHVALGFSRIPVRAGDEISHRLRNSSREKFRMMCDKLVWAQKSLSIERLAIFGEVG